MHCDLCGCVYACVIALVRMRAFVRACVRAYEWRACMGTVYERSHSYIC